MKQWNNPEMWKLSAEHTEAGSKGGNCDNVLYQMPNGGELYGSSGPALPYPVVKK